MHTRAAEIGVALDKPRPDSDVDICIKTRTPTRYAHKCYFARFLNRAAARPMKKIAMMTSGMT